MHLAMEKCCWCNKFNGKSILISIIMKLYVHENKINKPHTAPHFSKTNGFSSLSEGFICQLSESQRNLMSDHASKKKSFIYL